MSNKKSDRRSEVQTPASDLFSMPEQQPIDAAAAHRSVIGRGDLSSDIFDDVNAADEQRKQNAIEQAQRNALVRVSDGVYQFKGCTLSWSGIDFTGADLEQDDWSELLTILFAFRNRIALWVGDMLTVGHKRYYRDYDELAAYFGVSKKTLQNWHWICSSVESSLRREDLTITHYEIVAGLSPARKRDLLIEASEKGWSTARLKIEVEGRPATKNRPSMRKDPRGHIGYDLATIVSKVHKHGVDEETLRNIASDLRNVASQLDPDA